VLRLRCATADHPFFNRVMGLGASGEALERWPDRLIDDYREQGVGRWMLQASPAEMSPELEQALTERGLVALRWWAKHTARVGITMSPTTETDPRPAPRCSLPTGSRP
jgi:hypothetical protein